MLVAGAVVLLPRGSKPALPTIAGLRLPIPSASLDRTLTIGSRRSVAVGDRTRLVIESRYGQFRGHWWWNRGWVYVSGQALPGSQIHVHIDNDSLTITATPDAEAVAQVRRYGPTITLEDDVEVDVVRFGIGAMLFESRTTGGPFSVRHVVDQLQGRAWSSRGLTITRDEVASNPPDSIPCNFMQQPSSEWSSEFDLGCRLLGEAPLYSDRRGTFPSDPDAVVEAKGISLTATPNARTRLPADSLRVQW